MKAVQVFLSTILISAVCCQISPRIANGIPLDTFRRFPHHVSIQAIRGVNTSEQKYSKNCSGSIISQQWILTSMSCAMIGQDERLQLDFNRLHLYGDKGTYSVIVDSSYLTPYPTYYDDLALIKIPMYLQFSDTVKPIRLESSEARHDQQLAVMAGFNDKDNVLGYGMFRVLPTSECKQNDGSAFDEYLQICAQGYNNNGQVPCDGNQGGGLVVGWPHDPQLIGVFSSPLKCDSSVPAVYTRVSQYYGWISSVTGISTDTKDDINN